MHDALIQEVISVIETKLKQNLATEEERDVYDTAKEYFKNPFDFQNANIQINLNYSKYSNLFKKIGELPDTVLKKPQDITEADLKYILKNQIVCIIDEYLQKKNK